MQKVKRFDGIFHKLRRSSGSNGVLANENAVLDRYEGILQDFKSPASALLCPCPLLLLFLIKVQAGELPVTYLRPASFGTGYPERSRTGSQPALNLVEGTGFAIGQ